MGGGGFEGVEQSVQVGSAGVEMAREAHEPLVIEVDDWDFDPVAVPEPVLQVSPIAGRKWNFGHRAIPAMVIGDEGLRAKDIFESASSFASHGMGGSSEAIDSERFEKLDRRGDGEIGAGVSSPCPAELFIPGLGQCGEDSSPAQQHWPHHLVSIGASVKKA